MMIDENSHIQTHAVHPGLVDTELFAQTGNSLIPWFNRWFFKVNPIKTLCLNYYLLSVTIYIFSVKTVEEGSRSIVHAAISPKLIGKGGSYISNCSLARSNPATKNVALCEKLFKFTCEMLDIKEFGQEI